jgi:hypothetical protein
MQRTPAYSAPLERAFRPHSARRSVHPNADRSEATSTAASERSHAWMIRLSRSARSCPPSCHSFHSSFVWTAPSAPGSERCARRGRRWRPRASVGQSLVPLLGGQLARDHRRRLTVPVFEDLQEIAQGCTVAPSWTRFHCHRAAPLFLTIVRNGRAACTVENQQVGSTRWCRVVASQTNRR